MATVRATRHFLNLITPNAYTTVFASQHYQTVLRLYASRIRCHRLIYGNRILFLYPTIYQFIPLTSGLNRILPSLCWYQACLTLRSELNVIEGNKLNDRAHVQMVRPVLPAAKWTMLRRYSERPSLFPSDCRKELCNK